MDKKVQIISDCLRQRREQIADLLLEQKALCEELGEEPRPLKAAPLPTQEEIVEFCKHLQLLKDEREQRKKKLNSIRHETCMLLDILERPNSDEVTNLLYGSKIKLDKAAFNVLDEIFDSEQKILNERIDAIRPRLEILWEELATSPDIRNEFRKYTEYTGQTYQQIFGEIKRCEKLKELTLKSEQIIDKLNSKRNIMENLFIIKAKVNDPQRFHNRRAHLLHEEKQLRNLERKLANIDTEISILVKEYESEGKPFLINGVHISVQMDREWERKQQEIASARKPVPEAAATTPIQRRPMSLKNASQLTASTTKKRELAAIADQRSSAARRSLNQAFMNETDFANHAAAGRKTVSRGGHLSGGRNNTDDAGDFLDLTKSLKKSIQISSCPRIGSTAAAGRTPRLLPILGAGKENAPGPNTKK